MTPYNRGPLAILAAISTIDLISDCLFVWTLSETNFFFAAFLFFSVSLLLELVFVVYHSVKFENVFAPLFSFKECPFTMTFGCWIAATIVFLTSPHYYVLSLLLWFSSLLLLGNLIYNEDNKSKLLYGIPFVNLYIYLFHVEDEELPDVSKSISIKRMTFRIVEDVPMIVIAVWVLQSSVQGGTLWITWLNLSISSTNVLIWCLYEVVVMKNCICPKRVEEQSRKETLDKPSVGNIDSTSIRIDTV